jgi:AcrR family transcriptional regulator
MPSASSGTRPASDAERLLWTSKLADLALESGLGVLVLRTAAAQLGTSNRMLLYYFKSKAALVAAVLDSISDRQAALLNASPTGERLSAGVLLERAWRVVLDPRFVPYMRIWTEVTVRSTRGEEPFRELAQQTTERWLRWIESRIDLPPGAQRSQTAAAILTLLEGGTLLEMSKPGSAAGVERLLAAALDA